MRYLEVCRLVLRVPFAEIPGAEIDAAAKGEGGVAEKRLAQEPGGEERPIIRRVTGLERNNQLENWRSAQEPGGEERRQ